MFGQVGRHLQRTIHGEVEGQLSTERGVNIRVVVRVPLVYLGYEDAWSIIHRATLQTGKGQDEGVVRLAATKGLILGATCRLVAHEVWPCATQTSGASSFMGVHHDVVLSSLLYAVEVVVIGGLRVMIVATGDDVAHIATLHSIVAILIHQAICLFKMALIVKCRGTGFVVHHQLHALRVSIAVQLFNIKVGVRCLEIEHIIFIMTKPVFPTNVPALYQHLLQAVLSSKVDVSLHVSRVSGMLVVRFTLGIVEVIEMHRGQVVCVAPLASASNHLPPHATIFCGMYPRCVFNLARLIEVQDEV